MIFLKIFLVGAGGFLGAILRYEASERMKGWMNGDFPWGTYTVNLLGSFLLGFLIGRDTPPLVLLFAGTGLMGAFTTFSTFKFEAVKLLAQEKRITFYVYLTFSYAGGLFFAFTGLKLGQWFVY
ncbi:CrcB family protein [Halobacillus sp. ACCC02827]|uniref:fluoride efflux transporter FluC n=1 Tax=Halobacillus sp. ACCC02827 TaxID=3052090 RepID=UPI00256FEE12|nr:CrcB family protein [Halobacillus sp. ACCC02827]WJE14213.1 CrcB family protein [Halobacillus sp. ACCC02827]